MDKAGIVGASEYVRSHCPGTSPNRTQQRHATESTILNQALAMSECGC